MPEGIAVIHADLEPTHGRITDLSSKTGLFFMVLTILLGISCFFLSLMAEATRSEVYWMREGQGGKSSGCVYSGSGKEPLICGACASVGLAMAMVVVHAFMLIAARKSSPELLLLSLDPHSASAKSLTWQAGFFFVSTW